ncbi:uroporphyrinogen-III synthase [compost metagenome]
MPEGAGQRAGISAALAALEEYDYVFFTSVNGVEFFWRHLAELKVDIRGLHRACIGAVGPATAAALAQRGLMAEELPGHFQAEGLLEAFGPRLQPGQKVLLPRGDLARE